MSRSALLGALLLGFVTTGPALAQTQMEMNAKAAESFKAADAQLNKFWEQLLPKLEPAVKEKLVTSQLLWIKFRDAEAEAKSSLYEGGSIEPMIYSDSQKRSTETRIQELKDWLEHTESL